MKSFLLIITIFCTITIHSQSIEINEDSSIVKMTKYFVDSNKRLKYDGWRVQILSTTDRKKIDEVMGIAKDKYPEYNVDWVHNKPYYKVNIGAFLKKTEAQAFLNRVRNYFPNSYIIVDKIKPQELL
jgi:SPOR domain